MSRIALALATLVSAAALAGSAIATSTEAVELTCPVCGSKAWGVKIMSTNTYGGQDRDFLRRARGGQIVLLTPVTCPACLYSGYTGDFEKPVEDDLKKKIQGGALEPAPHRKWDTKDPSQLLFTEGDAPKTDFPAWVRHDLVLQVRALKGDDSRNLSWQVMQIAWALRLEENPFNGMVLELKAEDRNWLEETVAGEGSQPQSNPALQDVASARILAAKMAEFPAQRRYAAAVRCAWLLRTHGEYGELLKLWPVLKDQLPADGRDALETALKKSAELEASYQRKALGHFEAVLKDLSAPGKPAQELALTLYLCGELNRRIGDPAKAVEWFDKSAAVEGAEEWLKTYVSEQKALAASAK